MSLSGKPVNADGRKLLRIEAKNAMVPIEDKPSWIRTRAVVGDEYQAMKARVSSASLHTVCQEAGCPNIFECWEDREATFLIGGDQCTRRCDFCQIATGRPQALDRAEPRRVAQSVREMGLRYATITGVSRDDLPDGASWIYAETCRQIRSLNPHTGVELLVDDFRGDPKALQTVFDVKPEVFAHNLETVPRIFSAIRPAFRYERSLEVIYQAHQAGLVTKSNLILGMGESYEEIIDTMHDLRESECDILTITQYLRPTPLHHPIDRWVKPSEFVDLYKVGMTMGFSAIMSGPLVRSSYRAGYLYARAMKARGQQLPAHLADLGKRADKPAYQEAASLVNRHDCSPAHA